MTEPTYVPLLRQIANAECNAEVYLSAWAEATPRDDVRQVISTIALREGEHTKSFQKRLCELGYDVTIEMTERTRSLLDVVRSTTLTDREKFSQLGLGTSIDTSQPDRWACYFDDTTIDIQTGELLGRFVSEERDSVRMLAACKAALDAEAPAAAPATTSPELNDRLGRIEALLERLVANVG